jgi:hypothetical protein
MKEAGAAANDYHRMQVWAGQSAAMAKPIPAGELVRQLWGKRPNAFLMSLESSQAMSWFKRENKGTRRTEVFDRQRIDFIGEQSGTVEDELKARLREIFDATPSVRSAYLARLSYGEPTGYSVGLCIRCSTGVDQKLQQQLGEVFAKTFRSNQYLDILFIREDQELVLKNVCKAFFERN